MALAKSTVYAPDIYKALNGILLVYKPPRITNKEFVLELRGRISGALNEYQPRPISERILIEGDLDNDKSIMKVPNWADHPLVSGPRYAPWDLKMMQVTPSLGFRSSGLVAFMVGKAIRYYRTKMRQAHLVSVYHISGKFGFMTDTCFYDGNIIDKSTIKHIRSGKLDSVLAKIESTQHNRLFDAASVPLDSQEAYELAKAWPSRPPRMADWPVIYRLRCLHLKLPDFKIEVTVTNENEQFLAQLSQDVGLMLKSGAYTESIRRVKLGPFDVENSLTEKDWNMQAIIDNLAVYEKNYKQLHEILDQYRSAVSINSEHMPLKARTQGEVVDDDGPQDPKVSGVSPLPRRYSVN